MIELPEARIIARDLKNEILGKTITDLRGDFNSHKFTFYYKNPDEYKNLLMNKKITNIIPRNFYIEIEIENYKLIMRDGANIRYYDNRQDFPEKSQLLLEFNDGSFINVTVSMYACIAVFEQNENTENIYYEKELTTLSPLDKDFTFDYFQSLIDENTIKLSAKAFLATEQRITGIGNGIVQDILFNAKINPRTKIKDLSQMDIEILYNSVINTINNMINNNGRDTEKDIYNNNGKYITILSSKNYKRGCPNCHSEIKKEQFLGGSIYYCPNCQNKK